MVLQTAAPVRIPALRRAAPGAWAPGAREWCVRQEWRDPHDALIASGGRTADRCWMHWPAAGTFVFESSGDIAIHPDPRASVAEVDDTYFRGVLPVVFLARGYEAIHASAALVNGRVVCFAAESGTGKSTLAAAVARAGGTSWADDTVVWSPTESAPISVAMPHPRRLDAPAEDAVASVGTAAASAEPGSVAPLAAIYVVARHQSPAYVEFSRVPPHVAFRRVLAHAHPFELADERPRQLVERLLALSACLPIFELKIRSGLAHLPAVASIVQRHAASIATG